MKVTNLGPPDVPPVPDSCSRCGAELRGMGVDAPGGWLCAIDCGRPRDLIVGNVVNPPRDSRAVPFSQTGLKRPS